MQALWTDGRATFEGEHYRVHEAIGSPRPVTPGGPPLVIGGGSKRILTLAGQHAQIVSVVPSLAAGVVGPEVAGEVLVEKYAERVRWARQAAGDRAGELELQCWTVTVQVVPNGREVIEAMAPVFNLTPEQLAPRPPRSSGPSRRSPTRCASGARSSASPTSSCTRPRWKRWRR